MPPQVGTRAVRMFTVPQLWLILMLSFCTPEVFSSLVLSSPCELVFRVSKERMGNIPRNLLVSGRGAVMMELVVVLAWTWG